MSSGPLTITFSGFNLSNQPLPLSGEDIQKIRVLLKSKPDVFLKIGGLPCNEYVGCVDPDLEDLLQAYITLEQRILSGDFGKHSAFFGEGGLLINTTLTPAQASIKIVRSPHLNKYLTSEYKLEVQTTQHLAAWRNALRSLLQ